MNGLDRTSTSSLIEDHQLPPAPAGHVWVEWVGEASPLDSPVVRFGLMTGKYTAAQEKVIRRLMEVRIARVHRHTRTLRRGNGLGELPSLMVPIVRFGPDQRRKPGERGSFIQAIPFKAADAIKSSDAGHEFKIWRERDGEPVNTLTLPDGTLRAFRSDQFADFGSFRREMGW